MDVWLGMRVEKESELSDPLEVLPAATAFQPSSTSVTEGEFILL